MSSFAKTFSAGDKRALTVLEALNGSAHMSIIAGYAQNPETILNSTPNDIRKIANIFSLAEIPSEPFNIYDSLRTFVESLPVHFYVTDVMVSTLEGSTTEIPYSVILDNNKKIQYFGIDNMGTYMYNLNIATIGEIEVPFSLNLLGVEDDPTGYNDAVEYIRMQEKQMEAVAATDTTDSREFKVWAEPTQTTYSLSRSSQKAFTFACDNETAVYEDGVLTFTGSGIIEIESTGTSGGTIYISADGEVVKTYVVELVERHTCASDTWVTEIHPTDEYEGLSAKYCDVCGELCDTMTLVLCEEHSFGDSMTEVEAEGIALGYKECNICGYRTYTTEETEPLETIRGDVDNSGEVDECDSQILANYFAGRDVSGTFKNHDAADVDGNGSLTRADAMILARYVAD